MSASGFTAYERLTERQIEAMAETLWDFVWSHDPNNPECFKKRWDDAGGPARRHYRTWAQAVFYAAQEGKPQHGWFGPFGEHEHETTAPENKHGGES